MALDESAILYQTYACKHLRALGTIQYIQGG